MAEIRPPLDLKMVDHPSNADLLAYLQDTTSRVNDLHGCLEDHRKNTRDVEAVLSGQITGINGQLTLVTAGQADAKTEVGRIKKRQLQTAKLIGTLSADVKLVKGGLGTLTDQVNKSGSKKSVLFMGQAELAVKGLGLLTVAGGVWRFLEFMWPTILENIVQIHRFVMKG